MVLIKSEEIPRGAATCMTKSVWTEQTSAPGALEGTVSPMCTEDLFLKEELKQAEVFIQLCIFGVLIIP